MEIDTTHVHENGFNPEQISRTRAGIYFIPALLHHFGKARLPYPGGDKIGKRPIDEHVDGYVAMGYEYTSEEEGFMVQ